MKIGVIGSGTVGQTLAAGLAKHGHQVKIGSRDPSKLKEWASKNKVEPATLEQTSSFGDIVIIATNWEGIKPSIEGAKTANFKGKVVIDVTNPITMGPKGMENAASPSSAGELVQKLLPDAHVVKCWNIINCALMIDPNIHGQKPDMWVAGDNADAKKKVTALLKEVGWDTVYDLGDITTSRHLEGMAFVWILTCVPSKNFSQGLKLLH